MKKIITILLLFCTGISFSQNDVFLESVEDLKFKISTTENQFAKLELLDSLVNVIKDNPEFSYDSVCTATINLAIELDSFNMAASNLASLIHYYNNVLGQPEQGIQLFGTYFSAIKNKIIDRNIANLCINLGDSYYFTEQPDSAIIHYNKAIEYAEKARDEHTRGLAILYKGYYYSDKGDFVKASQNMQEASNIFIKVKDTFNIISTKNELSILYSVNGFYDKAREERHEAWKLINKSKEYDQLAISYFNEASDYEKLDKQELRIEYLLKAQKTNQKSKYFAYYNPIILCQLAVTYAENDSLIKAKTILLEAEKDLPEQPTGLHKNYYFKALKTIAFKEKHYNEALRLGIKHLEEAKNSPDMDARKNAQLFLSKVYEVLNKPDLALEYFRKAKTLSDSIRSVQNTNALAYYQTLYETAKRDRVIQNQENEIILLDEQNKRKKLLLWFGSFLLTAFFVIVYLWRSRNFSRKKTQLQKTFAQDLIRNVETERKRISSELHDSVGQSLLLIKNTVLLGYEKKTDTELIDNTIDEVRNISQSLHPFQFEKLGLLASIKNTVEAFQKNSEIFYSIDIGDVDLNRSKDEEIFVYRMVQECLNNVEKHSRAKACNVKVDEQKNAILFQIKDNGVGFDVTKDSTQLNTLGMKTLEERSRIIGAQLIVNSVRGKGTTVQIIIPKK